MGRSCCEPDRDKGLRDSGLGASCRPTRASQNGTTTMRFEDRDAGPDRRHGRTAGDQCLVRRAGRGGRTRRRGRHDLRLLGLDADGGVRGGPASPRAAARSVHARRPVVLARRSGAHLERRARAPAHRLRPRGRAAPRLLEQGDAPRDSRRRPHAAAAGPRQLRRASRATTAPSRPRWRPAATIDIVHVRYSAAHPGAERDVFPHLPAENRPGIVVVHGHELGPAPQSALHARTASARPRRATATGSSLSHPDVDVCATGPASADHVEQAIAARELGPMSEEELAWMRRVGVEVRRRAWLKQ